MIKLSENGAFLINGEMVEDAPANAGVLGGVSKEEGVKNTMAYGILDAHNTSGNMQDLRVKFDKIISHDIT